MVRDFFAATVRQCFDDLDLPDDGVADYLTGLLERFIRADAMHPAGATGARLVSLADRLAEVQRAWTLDGPHFDPLREVEIRRDLADYALVMYGFFWEHVRDRSAQRHHARQGCRSYRFVAEYHRARGEQQARVYAALAARFDTYAALLSYLRDVHLGADFAASPRRLPARFIVP
jgi:hypothetical protein